MGSSWVFLEGLKACAGVFVLFCFFNFTTYRMCPLWYGWGGPLYPVPPPSPAPHPPPRLIRSGEKPSPSGPVRGSGQGIWNSWLGNKLACSDKPRRHLETPWRQIHSDPQWVTQRMTCGPALPLLGISPEEPKHKPR